MFNSIASKIPRLASSFSGSLPNVLITGSGGRLGQVLSPVVNELGLNVLGTSREISTASQSEIKKALREHNISVIVNAAVVSDGPREHMQSINVDLPVRIAKAAQSEGIPFIQVSTTATQVSGIGSHTPYAESKLQAEQQLIELDNVKICRLDALVGESVSGKIDISYMERGGIALHFKGDDKIFQPTSYKAASIGLANIALSCIEMNSMQAIPTVVNIAGDPISISDFVRMLNQKAFELHVSPEDLLGIAAVVQNGSLTPEFLHLAMNSAKEPKIYCNAVFKDLLGNEKLPSPCELAKEIRDRNNLFSILKSGLEIFKNVSDKQGLFLETLKFARSTVSL